MLRLTLLTRRGCHLCDEMKVVVRDVERSHPLVLTEVDIASSPALERQWGLDIPVLMHGERVIARHRITARRLADLLSEATPTSR